MRKLAALLLLSSSVLASGAMAQSAPEASRASTAEAPGGEEIIVTAQNRKENVQNVPIAIAVISGDTLAKQGVTDFTAVTKVSPALQVINDTTNTRVTVRGVGTLSNNEAQDQSIAVNIDGEYINRPTILNAAIFDLDRVEVLRGPQGTLYGRNSTGGAVNFITRKPGNSFDANASVTYGNYNQLTAEAGVDVPLGGIGALRLSGIYTDHDGYNFHPNTPLQLPQYHSRTSNRSGDDHKWGGRASLRLTPVAGLTIDASVEHIVQDITPAAQAFVDFNAPGNSPGPGCNQNGFVPLSATSCIPKNGTFLSQIDRNSYNSPLSGVGSFHQISTAVRGRLAYDFGPATLTYTGGYRDSTNRGDNTLSPAYDFINFGASVKTQSHELRLNGTSGGIQWQTGAFYFKESQATDGGLYHPFIGPNGSYITYFKHPTDSESWSGFGQAEVPLVDRLTAVGGVRYTKDTRTALFSNYGFVFNSGLVPLTGPAASTQNLHYSGDKVSWLGGLNFKPNGDTLVYAKVSSGYKAGGFDGTGSVFRPETNTAYETGLKLKFGDARQHVFNVSGFYYNYKDLQNDVLLNPAIGAQTFNSGKATIWGVEAETTIKLSRHDTFNATVNYLKAKYDDFTASYAIFDTSNPNATAGPSVNLSGNRLPQTPHWVISVGYDHVFELGSAGTVTASAYSRFKSDYYLDFYNFRDAHEKAFTQTDLSLEYRTDNRRIAVRAYVQNLENYRPLVYAAYTAAGPDDIFNWQFGAPRTYGVRVSFAY